MNLAEFREMNAQRLFLRTQALDLANQERKAEKSLELWDAAQERDIATALNESSKPLYSNAEARKAELMMRQQASQDYLTLENALNDARTASAKNRAELEALTAEIDYLIASAGEEALRDEVKRAVSMEVRFCVGRVFGEMMEKAFNDPLPTAADFGVAAGRPSVASAGMPETVSEDAAPS